MQKLILVLLVAILLCAGASAAEPPEYDPALAAELGADDYGMRRYVMALLRAGPDRSHDAETAANIQRGHLEHIQRMAAAGKLVVAGPFLDDGELRGIFIFAVETMAEAEALAKADPAVQSGRLAMELKPWYGSAALLQLGDLHHRISRSAP